MMIRRCRDVITRNEGDKTLVFHQGTGWICILNRSSGFIWDQCEQPTTPPEIVERIRNEFDLPAELEEADRLDEIVAHHVDLMHKGQLLELVEA
jgi:hypothetical protein